MKTSTLQFKRVMKAALFILLLSITGTTNLWGQSQEIQQYIGDSSLTTGYLPFNANNHYSLVQEIYTAEEINTDGYITAISFNYTGNPSLNITDTIKIYLKHTSKTAFDSGNNWESINEGDLYYSGPFPIDSLAGWKQIILDMPFEYNGIDNLLVCIHNNTGGTWASTIDWYAYLTGEFRAICIYSDDTDYNPINASSYVGNLYNVNNLIAINIQPYGDIQLVATPSPIDLGYRPNNAWMRPAIVNITNLGSMAEITDIQTSNDFFQLDLENLSIPFILGYGQSFDIEMNFGTGEGTLDGNLVVNYNNDEEVSFPMTATAYTPAVGDVWESPKVVSSFPYSETLYSDSIPIYDNYLLPPANIADGPDVVYQLTFTEDTYLNASVTNGENGKMALYQEGFQGLGGPDLENNYTEPELATENWLYYDNGILKGRWYNNWGDCLWGIMFTPEQLSDYSGCRLTEISLFETEDNYSTITVRIYVGGDTPMEENLVLSQSFEPYGVRAFHEVVLDNTIQIDPDQNLWIVMFTQINNSNTYPISSSAYSGDPNGHWYFDGSNWNIFPYNSTWMIRGLVTTSHGRTRVLGDRSGEIQNMTVTPGTYYLAASSTSDEWNVEINTAPVPCPETAYNPMPENNAIDVNPYNLHLVWTLGERTTQYMLCFGSDPNAMDTLVNWTRDLRTYYPLSGMHNNAIYYWQVCQRNDGCLEGVEGPVWSFTTHLNVPSNLIADIENMFEGDSNALSWNAVSQRGLLSYNVYQDDVLIGTTTETYFDISDLSYNMTGYRFNVTAVYDEGESAYSNSYWVWVSGYGSMEGYVYEQDSITPIEGAIITINGYNEFDWFKTYQFTTDTTGHYYGTLDIGLYSIQATCSGYQPKNLEDFNIGYNDSIVDFNFILDELFNPVNEVTVEYYPDVDDPHSPYVKVFWDYSTPDRSFQHYRVYRTDEYNNGPFTETNTILVAEAVYDTMYIDTTWLELEIGSYKYGVSRVYMGNRESAISWGEKQAQPKISYHTEQEAPQHQAIIQNNTCRDSIQEPRESTIVWSDIICKDLFLYDSTMSITVTLNSGDSPEGIEVNFTNTNDNEQTHYPIDDIILDENGYYAWDMFRKGEYIITMSKDGYETLVDTVSILDTTALQYELAEIMVPVTNLYVSHTGWATWNGFGDDLNLRHFETMQVMLSDPDSTILYIDETSNNYMQLPIDSLVEGQTYHLAVGNAYSSGLISWNETDWVYEPCSNYEGASNYIGQTVDEGILLSWSYPEDALGVMAFRDGEIIGFFNDTSYLDADGSDDHEYLIRVVYGGEAICPAGNDSLSMSCPQVVEVLDPVVTQNVQLNEGWSWWNTYIEQSDIDGLTMLENALGTHGISIKSQSDGYTDYYDDYDLWYGSLESLNNESTYFILTNSVCEVSMTGFVADPSQHPIPVNANGWTWIGYPVNFNIDINEALANLISTDCDVVKAQEGFAQYYEDYGWYGTLETILPGMGLMYYALGDQPQTFTYPSTRSNAENTNLTAENNHWMPRLTAYPYNMTVTAVVELDDLELSSDVYELAAFANGECRGSVKLKYVEPLNRYLAFLIVAGKDAATLSFTLYDSETGMECFGASESFNFEANATIGKLSEPYIIHFRGTTGTDEWGSLVQVYPNPVAPGERFSVSIPMSEKHPVRVEIINTLGSVVSEETSNQLPASIKAPNTAGIYTLKISCEKGSCYRKVVVK